MKDTRHLLEWKEVRNIYKYLLENNYVDNPEQIKYRIECIDGLINNQEINPEHFK